MHPPVYAGTYAVRICHGACPASTYRTATLVLLDRPLRDAQGHAHGKWLEQGEINGCLLLDPVRGRPGGWVFYPGLAPRRFIVWTAAGDRSLRFELDRTVDAGYRVELRPTRSGLAGVGSVWSASEGPDMQPLSPGDEIRARRLGDADPARCPRPGGDVDGNDAFGSGVLRP
ncbi:MAG TPA: hypothetical protein VFR91_01490 [Dyella sp.]|nr:hypothetical protein [Dyella sp.]